MIYELRILSGLHRGATLPLDDHALVLGASEEADVVLADTGIEEKHATLLLTEAGWSLSTLDGQILTADSNEQQSLIDLVPGDFARVGDVWVTVVAQDAPWENPPPVPVDDHFDAVADEAESKGDVIGASAAEIAEAHEASADAMAAAGDESAAPAAEVIKEKSEAKRWRSRKIFYFPFAIAAVLSAAAAYAITASSSSSGAYKGTTTPVNAGTKPWAKSDDKRGDMPAPGSIPAQQPTVEELRKIFRKRLADADLLNRFDLDLADDAWFMQAALDDDEAARFERVLAKFMKTYNITFPVNAKVGSAEAMLPFKIRQVISGANASIITQDGTRLYIGDEYRGVRLVAVRSNQISFAGKRKIEVAW